ncbi:MAG: GNAT family N-acetyltransferase [Erythrobacter sp.]
MFYRSERLLLRPSWPEDWQGILAGIADEGVLRNLASAPNPYQEQDAREFAAREIPLLYPRFLITRAKDASIIGCIGVDETDNGQAEMGYWIARPHWGQGYATEAGRAAIEVSRTLGHTRINAAHFLDNPASGKVLRKIGFVPTGGQRRQYSYGRGEEATATEYAIDLEIDAGRLMRAA